jgi:hypothetical protein
MGGRELELSKLDSRMISNTIKLDGIQIELESKQELIGLHNYLA